MAKSKEDAWQKILDKKGIDPKKIQFVSSPINRDAMREFAEPRLIIPIYSREARLSKFPFLSEQNLTPIRTGIGTAVLTKADIFLPLDSPVDERKVITYDRNKIPRSLDIEINTEARFLALAYETGVFNAAFGLSSETRPKLGLMGKMNLHQADLSLIDQNQQSHSLAVSNVQFELDFSLETEDAVYLIEAKQGKPRSISALQLVYARAMFGRDFEKKIRTFVVLIKSVPEKGVTYTFHEFSFGTPLAINTGVRVRTQQIILEYASNQASVNEFL